jgi:N-acylneuraminate cytidylyltransferase
MHSSQYASLPEIYVQNASLEIAWSRTVLEHGSIAGEVVIPFISNEFEGFDINEPEDLLLAEQYVAREEVSLPEINVSSFYER